jgi:NAD(P)-dependent dehydrogenase (short-subunit alcohol dehydrogenase family)
MFSNTVNNAGSGVIASTLDHNKEQIEEMFHTNLFGAIFMTQAVVPHMPSGGRIINISSNAAKMGMAELPIYGATKAAIDSLSYAWAAEVLYFPIISFFHQKLCLTYHAVRKEWWDNRQLCCSWSSCD